MRREKLRSIRSRVLNIAWPETQIESSNKKKTFPKDQEKIKKSLVL